MTAEAVAHGGEKLVGIAVSLARAEPGIEGGGENGCRNRLLDGRHETPAPFARVFDIARESFKGAILAEGERYEIEQPGVYDAAVTPDLGDVREIEIEPLLGRQLFRCGLVQNVETFRISLHQPIFDAIVNHLDEMTGAGRSAIDIALLGSRILRGPARRQ